MEGRDYLYLAPLQSFTDLHFRYAFQSVYGDVDRFYAPYLKMAHDGSIKEGPKLDVLPENNLLESVVPQIMACSAAEFMVMAEYLKRLGYEEVNWNLGCPYPMVAKRDLGSGILDKPDKLFSILDQILPSLDMKLGIKMRMGYEDTSDILSILPKLNDYPLSEVIVHARYGKQLYNGPCDYERFKEVIPLTNHKLVFNGDITTVEGFREVKLLFPEINHFMIGRGAISNPLLFEMIQEDSTYFPEDRYELFRSFLEILLESHLKSSDNHGNILIKMTHYWEYFATSFENGHTMYRKVKKAKSIVDYQNCLDNLLLD